MPELIKDHKRDRQIKKGLKKKFIWDFIHILFHSFDRYLNKTSKTISRNRNIWITNRNVLVDTG